MKTKEIFEGRYIVYSDGRVWSNIRNKFLKQFDNGKGYILCSLIINRKQKSYKVHRLVAECFVPNPLNLHQVNHKDLGKSNNNDWNLEWCTNRFNQLHQYNSKFPGIVLHKITGRYQAKIVRDSKQISLGYYDTPDEASKVYMEYRIIHNLN